MFIVGSHARKYDGSRPWRLLSTDVKGRYSDSLGSRPLYMEISVKDREHGDGDRVGRHNLFVHGTRDAAIRWQAAGMNMLEAVGFTRGRGSLCNSNHTGRSIVPTAHRADFAAAAHTQELK